MKKTAWTYGLIAGGIMSVLMLITFPLQERVVGYEYAMIIGYTTMVLAFFLVFLGVRSYRDNVLDGAITFGRAVAVGSLIVVISSLCYTATWQVVYHKLVPSFQETFHKQMVDRARTEGGTPEEIAARIADADRFAENYKNPLVNVPLTFLEPLPVGLVVVLVTAGIVARKRRDDEPVFAAVATRN